MKRKMKGFRLLILCFLVLTCSAAFATTDHSKHKYKDYKDYKGATAPHHTPGYFELIGAPSLSKVDPSSTLGVTSSETDTLQQRNMSNWNSWGGQLGVGYVYFIGNALRYSEHLQWFPKFEPEANVYYNNYKNHGDVYRFGSSAFNQLKYNMPIRSTRLMLDGALTIVSKRGFSTYVIAGIGNAWNRVGYRDTVNAGDVCNTQPISLSNHITSHFAWEAGVGLALAFNERLGVSFEYLYTNYGKYKTTSSGNTGLITAPVITPASFNLHTQALLLGLHVTL